jgi:zinc resistance-associated protein
VENPYCRHHLLTIAGSTLVSAQQPSPTERSHRAQLVADDIAAFTDACIAALKTALNLTPDQEKNWPAVEQALRDISKERLARREARPASLSMRAPARSCGCVERSGRGAAALGRSREAAVPEP